MNLFLVSIDGLIDMFQQQYDPNIDKADSYSKAMDGGDYGTKNFITGNNNPIDSTK